MTEQTHTGCGCHSETTTSSCGCKSNQDSSELNTSENTSSCHTSSGGCSCPSKKGQFIDINFDGNEIIPCSVLAIFDINEQAYIALSHPDTKEQLLYRYNELTDNITLDVITGEEFELVAKVYQAIQ